MARENDGFSLGAGEYRVWVLSPETDNPEEIIALFERIASVEGWQPEGELRAHADHSTYFGLWQTRGSVDTDADSIFQPRLVGGLQLVSPDAMGRLPSHRVWPETVVAQPERTAHIAMLAVEAEWRGKAGGLFWRLTSAMWNHCVQHGIRDLYLEATPRTMRCYERIGWPLRVCGELREHWGEPCYLTLLSVREVAGALAERAVRSPSYRNILADMMPAGTMRASIANGIVKSSADSDMRFEAIAAD